MLADRQIPIQTKLDPRETHFRIPGHLPGLQLFLRHLPPAIRASRRKIVLYVHGGTFPSGLSIAYRFADGSWRDALCAQGYDVWALDFLGFGGSDRYAEMAQPAERHAALGDAQASSLQIERAVRFICAQQDVSRLSIVAHSWGCIAAGRFATACPELVDRLVFFGPVARRDATGEPTKFPAWRLVSLDDQWTRFTGEVPPGETPVLPRPAFDAWAPHYLDSDPASRRRCPASVQVPSGPWQDIADAWSGALAFVPAGITAPVAIIRGEWDSLATDNDARWLLDALHNSPRTCDVKIPRATHLMHLEQNRHVLYQATSRFLEAD